MIRQNSGPMQESGILLLLYEREGPIRRWELGGPSACELKKSFCSRKVAEISGKCLIILKTFENALEELGLISVLLNVSFHVDQGEIVGFRGPNCKSIWLSGISSKIGLDFL